MRTFAPGRRGTRQACVRGCHPEIVDTGEDTTSQRRWKRDGGETGYEESFCEEADEEGAAEERLGLAGDHDVARLQGQKQGQDAHGGLAIQEHQHTLQSKRECSQPASAERWRETYRNDDDTPGNVHAPVA